MYIKSKQDRGSSTRTV